MRLAHAKIAEIQREIELQVAAGPKLATRHDIEAAASRFYRYEVESDADERVHDVEFVRERMQANPRGYCPYVERLQKAQARMDYSEVEQDAKFVLGYEKLALDKETTLYREFLQLLMRARIQAAARWVEHDQAIFGEDPSDRFFLVATDPRQMDFTTPVKRNSVSTQ